jgi:exosortase D (VPLPA-CTERM-specific)
MPKSSPYSSNRAYDSNWIRVAACVIALAFIALLFRRTFVYLFLNWQREEYSYGFLIPIISLWLAWQRRASLASGAFEGSWWGVAVVAFGLGLLFLDAAASIVSVNAYALVIVIAGCIVAAVGWRGLRVLLAPVALLLLMVPLPVFWYNNLSSWLQLLSSRIGVELIRALGVSVFLEGNVIDLGAYKLQVAEACSGLRYLFPLLTLGVIVGYLFKGRAWMRWLIVLSTIPIAVLMNSARIGIIGILVDRFGSAQAEGFLHQFEGWVIFMTCFALLLAECLLLHRLSGDRRAFGEMMRWESDARTPGRKAPPFTLGHPATAAALVLALTAYPAWALPQRAEIRPLRDDFSAFPLQIGNWIGKRQRLDSIYIDTLRFDDYLLADYVSASKAVDDRAVPVNIYVAYYASQRSGQAEHSPGACLPAGGWHVQKWQRFEVPGVRIGGEPLRVNRAVIQKGSERQLVYYWFHERGRDVTSEYLAKWYLFADAVTRNRSDGALVRMITPLREGEDAALGDEQLRSFSASMLPILNHYVGS